MKKEFSAKCSLMMLAFITAVSMNANAQLGNLINKAKQKVKNKVENVVSDNSGSSSTSNVKSKVTEKTSGAAARKLAVKKFGEAPELPEIMAVSDRIITLCQGHLGQEFLRKDFSEQAILKSALPQTDNTISYI